MLRPFLLIFDIAHGPRQQIVDYLDTRPEVKNWFAFLPTAILVISDRNASDLAKIFREKFPARLFMVSEVQGTTTDGWQNQNVWDFLNNPKSSGRWP